ncbi:MAG: PIN domain-containing protein [Candidatus Woesearchaeota archaeon]
MKLIINTNRIMAALIKDSFSRYIIFHSNWELIYLTFSEQEIEKHQDELLKKSGLNKEKFELVLSKLKEKFILLNDDLIKGNMIEASKIMDEVDPDDTPFIAAALATGSDIWSDDSHFSQQKKIKVWKTKDLIKLL